MAYSFVNMETLQKRVNCWSTHMCRSVGSKQCFLFFKFSIVPSLCLTIVKASARNFSPPWAERKVLANWASLSLSSKSLHPLSRKCLSMKSVIWSKSLVICWNSASFSLKILLGRAQTMFLDEFCDVEVDSEHPCRP